MSGSFVQAITSLSDSIGDIVFRMEEWHCLDLNLVLGVAVSAPNNPAVLVAGRIEAAAAAAAAGLGIGKLVTR